MLNEPLNSQLTSCVVTKQNKSTNAISHMMQKLYLLALSIVNLVAENASLAKLILKKRFRSLLAKSFSHTGINLSCVKLL